MPIKKLACSQNPIFESGELKRDSVVAKTATTAAQKAEEEFDKYRTERSKTMIPDFDLAVKELENKGKPTVKKL